MGYEGCEYSILATPCETLLKASQYLEIHGAPMPVTDCMEQCGFKPECLEEVVEDLVPLTLWIFVQ